MTDLYTTYQAAITAGGTITVPPGTYTLSQPLLLPQDTPVTFDGYDVIVVLDAGCPGGFFQYVSSADDQIWRNITWRGFTVDASHVTYEAGSRGISAIGPVHGTTLGSAHQNNLHDILIQDLDIYMPPSLTTPEYVKNRSGIFLLSRQSSTSVGASSLEHITVRDVTVHGGDMAVEIVAFRGYAQGDEETPWAGNTVWMNDINVIDCYHVPDRPAASDDHLPWNAFHIGSMSHGGSVLVSGCSSYGAGEGGLEVNGFANTVVEHFTTTDSSAVGFMFYNFNDLVDPATQTILFDDCHCINTGPLVFDVTEHRTGFRHIANYGSPVGAVTFRGSTAVGYSDGYDFYVLGVRSVTFLDSGAPPTPNIAKPILHPTQPPSLRIGSDVLGWQEFGGVAQLGAMTRATGGDGSLEFTLPGSDASKLRNVLVPGARVILTPPGGRPWGGRVANDPVRHRLSCQDVVEVACSGLYGLSARDGRFGYIGIDTDPEQWKRGWYWDQHPGRFTARKEGVIELRADNDRAYAAADGTTMHYDILDGLRPGTFIAGMSFERKCNLPNANWTAAVSLLYGGGEWIRSGGGAADWTPVLLQAAADISCQTITLELGVSAAAASGSLETDPYVRLRKIHVYGRWSDAEKTIADTDLTIGSILTDCAAALGVTTVAIDSALSAFVVEQFVARFPTTIAETMRQAVCLYTGPIEAFFDLDPITCAERFTARAQPAATALAPGNRHWILGGRGGEDTRGLVRDWEATPEQLQVLYAVRDHAELPDGTVQSVTYPGGAESAFPCAEIVDLTQDKTMSAATAGNYAQAIWAARQSNRYTGEVAVAQTARTAGGIEESTTELRPGDRITALDRDDTSDMFGETLYVQETAYDWRTQTATATVGLPFDPLEIAPRSSVSPKHRTGIA